MSELEKAVIEAAKEWFTAGVKSHAEWIAAQGKLRRAVVELTREPMNTHQPTEERDARKPVR